MNAAAADKSWNNKQKPQQKSQEKLQGKLQEKFQDKLQEKLNRRQQSMEKRRETTSSNSNKTKPVRAPLVRNVTSKPKLQEKKLKVS